MAGCEADTGGRRQVRSGDSDFQEDPVIESKLKRLTFTNQIVGASDNR